MVAALAALCDEVRAVVNLNQCSRRILSKAGSQLRSLEVQECFFQEKVFRCPAVTLVCVGCPGAADLQSRGRRLAGLERRDHGKFDFGHFVGRLHGGAIRRRMVLRDQGRRHRRRRTLLLRAGEPRGQRLMTLRGRTDDCRRRAVHGGAARRFSALIQAGAGARPQAATSTPRQYCAPENLCLSMAITTMSWRGR